MWFAAGGDGAPHQGEDDGGDDRGTNGRDRGGTSDGGASEPVEAIAETFEEVPAVPGGSQTLPAPPEGEPARPAPPPSATTSGLAGFVLLESAIVARLARTGREQRAATIDRVSMMFSYAAFAGTFVALVATA